MSFFPTNLSFARISYQGSLIGRDRRLCRNSWRLATFVITGWYWRSNLGSSCCCFDCPSLGHFDGQLSVVRVSVEFHSCSLCGWRKVFWGARTWHSQRKTQWSLPWRCRTNRFPSLQLSRTRYVSAFISTLHRCQWCRYFRMLLNRPLLWATDWLSPVMVNLDWPA